MFLQTDLTLKCLDEAGIQSWPKSVKAVFLSYNNSLYPSVFLFAGGRVCGLTELSVLNSTC